MEKLAVQMGNRNRVLDLNLQDVFFSKVAVFGGSRANTEGLIC